MANYKSDEEYQFSEAETPGSYTTQSNQSTTDKDFQSRKKGRNIILFLAILMAFWAIYKFVGIFLSQGKQTAHKPTAPVHVQQPSLPPTTLSPKIQAMPQAISPIKPISSAPSPVQLQEISAQKERVDKLETQIVNLQTTLSEISTKLSDVSNEVINLTSQATKPPPAEIKKPIRLKKLPAAKKHTSHNIAPSYHLAAVIPGRAWIMRSDGTNLTVTVGDRISGYGTVIGIDPNEGVVQMSSGANIKYNSH